MTKQLDPREIYSKVYGMLQWKYSILKQNNNPVVEITTTWNEKSLMTYLGSTIIYPLLFWGRTLIDQSCSFTVGCHFLNRFSTLFLYIWKEQEIWKKFIF